MSTLPCESSCRGHFVCPRCGPHASVTEDWERCVECDSPVIFIRRSDEKPETSRPDEDPGCAPAGIPLPRGG